MSLPLPAARLADAECEAALARDRMTATLATLQRRLDPRAFARDAVRDASDRSSAAAQASLETARRNPGVATGIAAAIGLFAIGRPLLRLVRRRRTLPSAAPIGAPAPSPAIEGSNT